MNGTNPVSTGGETWSENVAFDRLLAALHSHGSKVTGNGGQRMAQCPAHEDRNPSLSVTQGTDKVLVRCHGGCDTDDVLAALDLVRPDLFDEPRQNGSARREVAAYDYTDEAGHLLYQVVRFEPKTFRPRRPEGTGWTWGLDGTRRVPYRLPAVLTAAAAGQRVFVVEGERDVHAVEAAGAVATCNPGGARKWRDDYTAALVGADVVVVADRDDAGRAHARQVLASLIAAGIPSQLVEPTAGKDAADHLAAGLGLDDLAPVHDEGQIGEVTVATLDDVHAAFRRWLGNEYDLEALDVVLAVTAVERLGGDPAWLLMISGSGNAKTETVAALTGSGAHITSTIASEGALLSATSRKETAKNATGGLLRKIGPRGVLVIKDFTSILSMNRDQRAAVLAALREVYDGYWERNVGTDGGRTLTWTGRIVLIGAVTSAYDSAHGVIAAMGDRFALVRVDSNLGRHSAGRQAIGNVDREVRMRAELAQVVGGVLEGIDPAGASLGHDVTEELLLAADLVTLARTAVDRDYRGDVVDAHQPEMPTRFAKMLGQVVRGGLALGMAPEHALSVARRVAHDSMPPLRFQILADVWRNPGGRVGEVTRRVQKPRSTVDRTLQELHVLGLLTVDDDDGLGRGWAYRLSGRVNPEILARTLTRIVSTGCVGVKEERDAHQYPGTNNSGERSHTTLSDLVAQAEPCDICPSCGEFQDGRCTCAETCGDCGWPIDSIGHETACTEATS